MPTAPGQDDHAPSTGVVRRVFRLRFPGGHQSGGHLTGLLNSPSTPGPRRWPDPRRFMRCRASPPKPNMRFSPATWICRTRPGEWAERHDSSAPTEVSLRAVGDLVEEVVSTVRVEHRAGNVEIALEGGSAEMIRRYFFLHNDFGVLGMGGFARSPPVSGIPMHGVADTARPNRAARLPHRRRTTSITKRRWALGSIGDRWIAASRSQPMAACSACGTCQSVPVPDQVRSESERLRP